MIFGKLKLLLLLLLLLLFESNMADQFEWPWQYNFPPFFTIQPNSDTRSKQIDDWCELVLSYYKANGLHRLDVSESQSSALFNNKNLNRKLPAEGIQMVLEKLRSKGNLDWEDSKLKTRCIVMWKTPDEWADLIFDWVQNSGLTDTVCTLFEIVSGEEAGTQEFKGLDMAVLKKSLQVLEKRGKAQLICTEDSNEETGVKFFS